MSEKMPQTYANHTRLVPLFHYVTLPLVFINLIWAATQLLDGVTLAALNTLGAAFALAAVAVFSRVNALRAQDRVIRLEERLRLHEQLPDDLKPRTNDLTTRQLIALRFASDGELAGLVRKALDENADEKTLKQAIKTWRPDYQRV